MYHIEKPKFSLQLKNYYQANNLLFTLFSNKPISFTDLSFSVAPYALSNRLKTVKDFSTPTDLENAQEEENSIAINRLFAAYGGKDAPASRLLILGVPGVGKTTLCRRLLLDWSNNKWAREFDYVFLLPLRNLKAEGEEEKQGLASVICRECLTPLFDQIEPQDKVSFTDHINKLIKNKSSSLLLLIDGYDEIAERAERSDVLKKLLNSISEMPYWITTSRPDYLYHKSNAYILENTGFSNYQVEKYIKNYFKEPVKNGEAEVSNFKIFLQNNFYIWELIHIPLYLELLCDIWQSSIQDDEPLSENMTLADLYNHILKYMLKRYLNRRNIHTRGETVAGLSRYCQQELSYLEILAFLGLKEGLADFNSKLQKKVLDLVNENYLDNSKQPLAFSTVVDTGFFQPLTANAREEIEKPHQFLHLTLQEFLAAHYLVKGLNQPVGSECYEEALSIVCLKKYHSRYNMVLRFMAGLLSENSKLEKPTKALLTFWQALADEPIDITQGGHLHIVMLCLESASCDQHIPEKKKLLDWINAWFKKCLQGAAKENIEGNIARTYLQQLLSSLIRAPLLLQEGKFIDTLQEILSIPNTKTKKIAIDALKNLPNGIINSSKIEAILKLLFGIIVGFNEELKQDAVTTLQVYLANPKLSSEIQEKFIFKPILSMLLNNKEEVFLKGLSLLIQLSKPMSPFILVENKLIHKLMQLTSMSTTIKVRQAVIKLLSSLDRAAIKNSLVLQQIIEVFFQALQDSDALIQQLVVQSINQLSEFINAAALEKIILVLLQKAIDPKVSILPDILVILRNNTLKSKLTTFPLAKNFFQDLFKSMGNQDLETKKNAILAIKNLKDILTQEQKTESISGLLLILANIEENLTVRCQAISTVAELINFTYSFELNKKVVNIFNKLIIDSISEIQASAIQSLIYLPYISYETSVVNILLEQSLKNPPEQVQQAIAKTLCCIVQDRINDVVIKKIIPALLKIISTLNVGNRKCVMEIFNNACAKVMISRNKQIVLDILLNRENSNDYPKIQYTVLRALRYLSKSVSHLFEEDVDTLFDYLLPLTEDADPWLRKVAFEVFGYVCTLPTFSLTQIKIIENLLKAAKSSLPKLQLLAVSLLGKLSHSILQNDEELLQKIILVLSEVITTQSFLLKKTAINSLAKLINLLSGTVKEQIISTCLLSNLNDDNIEVQKTAIEALKSVNKDIANQITIEILFQKLNYIKSDPSIFAQYQECWIAILELIRTIPIEIIIESYNNEALTKPPIYLAYLCLLQGLPTTLTFTMVSQTLAVKTYEGQKEVIIEFSGRRAQVMYLQLHQAFKKVLSDVQFPRPYKENQNLLQEISKLNNLDETIIKPRVSASIQLMDKEDETHSNKNKINEKAVLSKPKEQAMLVNYISTSQDNLVFYQKRMERMHLLLDDADEIINLIEQKECREQFRTLLSETRVKLTALSSQAKNARNSELVKAITVKWQESEAQFLAARMKLEALLDAASASDQTIIQDSLNQIAEIYSSSSEITLIESKLQALTVFYQITLNQIATLLKQEKASVSCFLCYAPTYLPKTVMRLSQDLQQAEIQVFDLWQAKDIEVFDYLDNLGHSHYVLVIGTPALKQIKEDDPRSDDLRQMLKQLANRYRKSQAGIIKLLYAGSSDNSFPAFLATLSYRDFHHGLSYYSHLLELLEQPLLSALSSSNREQVATIKRRFLEMESRILNTTNLDEINQLSQQWQTFLPSIITKQPSISTSSTRHILTELQSTKPDLSEKEEDLFLPEPFSALAEDTEIDQAVLASQRSIKKVMLEDKVKECVVVPAYPDGNCGFTAIRHGLLVQGYPELANQFYRAKFITLIEGIVTDSQKYARYQDSIAAILQADRASDINDWRRKFTSSGYWLQEAHFKFISAYFNIAFYFYYLPIDTQHHYFEAEPSYDTINQASRNNAITLYLAHVKSGLHTELNHFDTLIIEPTDKQKQHIQQLLSYEKGNTYKKQNLSSSRGQEEDKATKNASIPEPKSIEVTGITGGSVANLSVEQENGKHSFPGRNYTANA